MQVQIYCLPISATLWFYPSNNTVLPHTIWCHYKCISEFLQTCLVTITAAVVQHGEVPNTDGNISKMSNREKLETRIGTQRMIARKVLTPFTIPLPRTHALLPCYRALSLLPWRTMKIPVVVFHLLALRVLCSMQSCGTPVLHQYRILFCLTGQILRCHQLVGW